MIWGMWEGLVGRVRTQLVAWDLIRRAEAAEEADLQRGRELDAADFGRRADARARAKSESPRDPERRS